jgi:predicted nucleic acid-binding protein
MRKRIYFDTSALAKWYLNEKGSEDVERYIRAHGPVAISGLTVLEMRSLLARRRRESGITAALEMRVFAVFEDDIRAGFLERHPLDDDACRAATHLLAATSAVPLRALDALHLALARRIGTDIVATADRVVAAGAESLGLAVARFG